MKLAIATVNRVNNYLKNTLDSLEQSGWKKNVQLYLGTPDNQHITDDLSPLSLDVFPISIVLWNKIKDMRDYQKYVANFLRILEADNSDIFICEDDILFSKNWFQILEKIKNSESKRMISLYSSNIYEDKRGWCEKDFFYGTCGIYYPSKQRYKLAVLMRERFNENVISVDDLINKYLSENDEKIIISIPSCVDHRGDESSIAENRGHGPRRAGSWHPG